MSNATHWETIWLLMRRNDFQLLNEISDEYKCTICTKVLVNACNAPCGCRFCSHCVAEYLGDGDKHCPGTAENCKEDLINFGRDIQTDRAINIRISKMVVKCPERLCKFRDELRKIEPHIEWCRAKQVKCPFFDAGCAEARLISDKMEKHLEAEGYGHAKLLMDYVGLLKREVESMRKEIDVLKIDAATKQVLISQLMRGAWERKADSEPCAGNETQEAAKQEFPVGACSVDLSTVTSEHGSRKRKNVESTLELVSGTKLIKTEKMTCAASDASDAAEEFQWRVSKFSEKMQNALDGINTEIHSEPFYSHRSGYKLRLVLCPGGSGSGKGTHLSIFFQIMKGEFDALLSWPMKHVVTVIIASQQNGLESVQRNYHYDSLPDKIRCTFLQPVAPSEFNTSCGNPRFISLDSLTSNGSLYKNDEIILKCSVAAFKHK